MEESTRLADSMYRKNVFKKFNTLSTDSMYRKNVFKKFNTLSTDSIYRNDFFQTTDFEECTVLEKENMKHAKSKLTLMDVLKIRKEKLKDESFTQIFLRKLMAVNITARNSYYTIESANLGSDVECDDNNDQLKFVGFNTENIESDSIHPLDELCVLLNHSDNFLQQEIVSKMAMCQFAVPLLLPAGDGINCTFMLWAMRDIVKRWRPHSLAASKGFMEDSLVTIPMPTFSFVRLGKPCKSTLLNLLLSSRQQHHDFFIHDNMEGGDIKRKISDGLVEMSWYFPSGSESSDIFPEPIAVTNLRGDLESNWTQFIFLSRVSSVVFIFTESIGEREFRLLSNCDNKDTEYHFILTLSPEEDNNKEQSENLQKFKSLLQHGKNLIIVKSTKDNETVLVKHIQSVINISLKMSPKRIKIQDMEKQIGKLDIHVDESSAECSKARELAGNITREIKDVAQYKKETRNFFNDVMLFAMFLGSLSHIEEYYFFKWMKLDLELISLKAVLKYKEALVNDHLKSKEELEQLDHKIAESSLGIEHFLRVMGQLYEAECSKINEDIINKDERQFTSLPGIAADLLLDGLPLELIDGDASNIPLQWITDVLTELDTKTGGQCRMRVITVLGGQGTGKSTLLNTMFGLQFPVASGRCTRGAFMTLIRVEDDFQVELGCDFILVIDTEGLKAPELASLKEKEHANELVKLVVELSNITIINMVMENMAESMDILHIVVQAFLRMNKMGKKPKCLFVYQHVSEDLTHAALMRNKKKLSDILDTITKASAKLENKQEITTFSDVTNYDIKNDIWYIPNMWLGVPPMATVNYDYSEIVSLLKSYLLNCITKQKAIIKPLNCSDMISQIFLTARENLLERDVKLLPLMEGVKWVPPMEVSTFNWEMPTLNKETRKWEVSRIKKIVLDGECIVKDTDYNLPTNVQENPDYAYVTDNCNKIEKLKNYFLSTPKILEKCSVQPAKGPSQLRRILQKTDYEVCGNLTKNTQMQSNRFPRGLKRERICSSSVVESLE